jgi:D-alanyl-D-alanine endopeptidase (penicillin-binding protein 7)
MRTRGIRRIAVLAMLLAVSGAVSPSSLPETEPTLLPEASLPESVEAEARERFWDLSGSPDVRSASAVIFDELGEEVLYAKDANVVRPIASITKLMTALVVREAELPLDEVIKITLDDRDTERGTSSRLRVGTQLTRDDLLHLALMSSENRAAHALGRTYPGGLPAFLNAMNEKARALGMTTARFVDPTGLSSGNVASAADLVKLVLAAARDPLIREYSTSPSHVVEVGGELLEYRNSNLLVTKDDWQIVLQKTGYTSDAGQCLVMTALVQERPVVMVLLNSFGKYTRIADARRVRRWMESGAESARVANAAAPADEEQGRAVMH